MSYSATPSFNTLGTDDQSRRVLPPVVELVPMHAPLCFLLTKRGRVDPVLTGSAAAQAMYGAESFDELSKFANHQTLAVTRFLAEGNPVFIHRLKPANAKTAMLRLSVELIPTRIPVYQRDPDGLVLLQGGEPVVQSEINGTRLVWHKRLDMYPAAEREVGKGRVNTAYRSGSDVSSDSATDYLGCIPINDTEKYHPSSRLYPIVDLPVDNFGEWGNGVGLRLFAPTTNDVQQADVASIENLKTYLYRLQCVEKLDTLSTPSTVGTVLGDDSITGTFKLNTRDPRTRNLITFQDTFTKAYQDIDNPNQLATYGVFESMVVYENNLADVLTRLTDGYNESTYAIMGEGDYDTVARGCGRHSLVAFKDNPTNRHLLNIFTGVDYNGVPYFTVDVDNSTLFGGITFKNGAVHYATGGEDGLVTDTNGQPDKLKNLEIYDNLTREQLLGFGSLDIKYLDFAKYPFSAWWDTGYSQSTKFAASTLIIKRPDVWIAAATQAIADKVVQTVDNGNGPVRTEIWSFMPTNTADQELAMAGALRTAYALTPESEVYGTPACRAIVVGREGRILNSWAGRYPLTLDLSRKVSRYAGASNGKLKNGFSFNSNPNNIVEDFTDVNITWQPKSAYEQSWAAGMIWVQNYDMRRVFYPATQTVYPDDTSVLNSLPVIMAVCEATKVAFTVWRDLVGNDELTIEQFLERSNRFIIERLSGRFDNRFVFQADTIQTGADKVRGFSWQTKITMYANNMRTVNEFTLVSKRMADLLEG